MPIPILIANWSGEEAIELCIESILKRTDHGTAYEILVLDSTGKGSREREYLLKQKEAGRIKLITREKRQQQYEALPILIEQCCTKWACILDSDVEIISGDWLKALFAQIKTERDLVVGHREATRIYPVYDIDHPEVYKTEFFIYGSRIMPFCMLLNLSLYKPIANHDDWDWMQIPWEDYPRPEEFDHIFQLHDSFPDRNLPGKNDVFRVVKDVGGRFIDIAKRHGFIIRGISREFLATKMKHMEMLSHARPGRKERKAAKSYKFHSRLEKLRKEA